MEELLLRTILIGLQALLVGVSGYVTTMLLTVEEGPFDMFVRFREWVGVVTGMHGESIPRDDLTGARLVLAKALTCPYCTSVYTTVLLAVPVLFYNPNWIDFPLSVPVALGVARLLIVKELK